MLIQVSKVLNKYHLEWERQLLREDAVMSNPFAFDNVRLWEEANAFLERYKEKEVKKMIEGKRAFVFTNRKDILFTRYGVDTEAVLVELIAYLEQECQENVSAIDRAYLECVLYNEVEEAISDEMITKGFIIHSKIPMLDYYLFLNKMKMLLQVGDVILFNDLEELYAAYNYKVIWKYHYEI